MSDDVVDQWRDRDRRRHSPEVDYGQGWMSERFPDAMWRVSWNTGTGELHAARRDDADLHVLGIAKTLVEVEQAMQGWGAHAGQRDGLDWVFERTRGLTGDGELSIHLARLRADLAQLAPSVDPVEPPGRPGLSIEL